jgi:hypothetical protein
MNEQQIAYKIRRQLEDGPEPDRRVLDRLGIARAVALSRQQQRAPFAVMVWAGDAADYFSRPSRFLPQLLLPVLLLIGSAIALNQWRVMQQAEELEEIDAAILTGDLPFHAYLDKGFDAWMKKGD